MPVFATRDPAFRRLLEVASRAARTDANVLLTGESGTGKNRLARFIHEHSARSDAPFIEVPCANLPAGLVESALFGHEKGAFTDAHEMREGRFEQADGGTLYLDEIQELQIDLQAKVLRALEDRRFERLGGSRTLEADLRFIACTREDPDRLVAERRLRRDLFYRLNVVRLDLPPLRSRRSDIPLLAAEFLRDAVERHRLEPLEFSDEAMRRMVRYPWPGNARELRHAVESAAVLTGSGEIGAADLPRQLSLTGADMLRSAAEDRWTMEAVETAYIREVLARTRGNKSAAARILGIHRKTLHEKLRRMEEE